MELKIKSKQEKPLLDRIEIEAELAFSGSTPKKEEAKKFIISKINSDAELTVVRKIDNIFGMEKANVLVYVYKDAEAMKKIEPKEGRKAKEKREKAEAAKKAEEKGE